MPSPKPDPREAQITKRLTGAEPDWAVQAKLANYPLCTECLEPLTLYMIRNGWTKHPFCSIRIGKSEGLPPQDEPYDWRARTYD